VTDSRTYRADVVGSLLRPAFLVEARRRLAAGEISAAEFKREEDRAVDLAVELQEAAGLDVVTDGELRRVAFYGGFMDAVEGFDREQSLPLTFHDESGAEATDSDVGIVVSRLRLKRSIAGEELTYLRARARRATPKVTLISPSLAAAFWQPPLSLGAYPTVEAYAADVVDVLRGEIDELVRLGCTYVQLDAPNYTHLADPAMREWHRSHGVEPEAMLDAGIEMDNALIDAHPEVTFGVHLCRGNYRSKFLASGGYGPVERIFSRSHCQRFLLEFDDERSGGFEPLRAAAEDKVVVLGLVSSKRGAPEPAELLERRIAEASRIVPIERLALSPQCGFASNMAGNLVSEDEQRRKLELVGSTAARVWSRAAAGR
jgi:5-methyltetrahydropteroyltriglutamate--homocysteine methyltransferase